MILFCGKYFPVYHDLTFQQARSRYMGKPFVSYESKVNFHTFSSEGEISLVNLSKSFLAKRDYLSHMNRPLYYVLFSGTSVILGLLLVEMVLPISLCAVRFRFFKDRVQTLQLRTGNTTGKLFFAVYFLAMDCQSD